MILLPIITVIDTFTIVQHDNKKKKKKENDIPLVQHGRMLDE